MGVYIVAIGDIVVGLDIGVSKVSCVIGQVNKFSEIEVIGYGLANNSGVKKGQIIDIETVGNSIKKAITSAEKISELSVNSAYVNIKGLDVRIEKVIMESEVEKPNDGMTINDIYALYSKIQMTTHLERNEKIIDILPYEYNVNGRVYKEEPIGAFCKSFTMECEVIIADGDYIAGVQKALKYAGLNLDGLILETLATSNIVFCPVSCGLLFLSPSNSATVSGVNSPLLSLNLSAVVSTINPSLFFMYTCPLFPTAISPRPPDFSEIE